MITRMNARLRLIIVGFFQRSGVNSLSVTLTLF